MTTDAALTELKDRNPCDQVAARWVTLRKHGRKLIGPCPICSSGRDSRKATRFECDADGWVCAVCHKGGDVIKLVQEVEQLDFRGAIAWLGGTKESDPATAAARQHERETKRLKDDKANNEFRERERNRIFEIWKRGLDAAGSPVEDYLRLRGLALPAGCRLRCILDMPYYATGSIDAPVVHRGPAMLAPILDAAGKFRALHTTWLDLDRPNGKALILDPDTKDEMPGKKVRGSKAGNRIVLVPHETSPLETLYIGEGIETVLSVWRALDHVGRDLGQTAFWSAVDLGNIGGKATLSVPHPSLMMPSGRRQHVPGPDPDMTAIGIAIPESVTDLILLGDGDSDRFTTQCALARAAQRYARPGRTVRVAWAPEGMDFNDMLRAA